MSYTILGARYANPEQTAAVARTAEAGDVVVSQADTPAEWARLLQGEVQAYVQPVATPRSVTKRQATQALILAGLDEQVEAILAAMPGVEGKLARAEWRECNDVLRDRPLVLQMAQALGITDAQLDELFNTAEGLS